LLALHGDREVDAGEHGADVSAIKVLAVDRHATVINLMETKVIAYRADPTALKFPSLWGLVSDFLGAGHGLAACLSR
jgi:hypothetical protein